MGSAFLFDRRNLLQHQPVNFEAAVEKMFFESGGGQIEIADGFFSKRSLLTRPSPDLLEIIMRIGSDYERTAGHKRAMNRLKEFVSHNAPVLVSPLRPGIGEQQVKNGNGIRRK